MPGLVPGIHVFLSIGQDVDGRDKPGHDEGGFVPDRIFNGVQ
jgi:2-oxoglutarate ferredoxin oxidoreductase subunit beta